MNLTNGCYYFNADGVAVRCQLHGDDFFHIFNADGDEIDKIPVRTAQTVNDGESGETDISFKTHVEGWVPIGASQFNASKLSQSKGLAKAKVKRAEVSRKKRGFRSKETKDEGEAKEEADDPSDVEETPE